MKIDLSGRLAVVTGASGDLGRVMARTLARCGCDVVIHYHRNKTMALQLVKEIRILGRYAVALQADVGDRKSVFGFRDNVLRQLRAPDILVNNAVIQYPWKPVLEQPVKDYEGQFRSSVLQNVLMAQAFVPAMKKKSFGRVIAISTECAMMNFEGQSAYVSGKRGMDGVLRVLAREVGEHGITVNQVAPGWTIGDKERKLGNRVSFKGRNAYASKVPLRRRGTDQEIANVVAFLASDLAGFITGAYVPVCGGNVMPAI